MPPSTLRDPTETVRWFRALSDPTRVEIVRLLSHGQRCVCELQDRLNAAQSRLSFHLRVLKDAGLVTDRRDGRWVYYALNRGALEEIAAFATAVRPGKHAGTRGTDCCG